MVDFFIPRITLSKSIKASTTDDKYLQVSENVVKCRKTFRNL